MTVQPQYIKRQWFNKHQPGSYDAFYGFWKNKKLRDIERVKENLRQIKTYTIHAPIRKKFRRRSAMITVIDHTWTSDLIDYQSLSNIPGNRKFKFVLVVVDCFSKFLWTEPLKNKTATAVRDGFKAIFRRTKRRPLKLWTDKGKEYYGRVLLQFLDQNNIEIYSTQSITKANIAERKVGQIKTKLARIFTKKGKAVWLDELATLTNTLNNTYHRSIKRTPNQVNDKNEGEVLMTLFQHLVGIPRKKKKFQVSDLVRVSRFKSVFEKGYTANYSTEVFRVKEVRESIPVTTYKLEDLNSPPEDLGGHYYEEELILVGQNSIDED